MDACCRGKPVSQPSPAAHLAQAEDAVDDEHHSCSDGQGACQVDEASQGQWGHQDEQQHRHLWRGQARCTRA